jgi:hypothetical protein
MSRKSVCYCACAVAVLAWFTVAKAIGEPVDHRTFFTFSGPVELPGVALPPGKYLFRVVNPTTSGNVVQVLDADGKQVYGLFFTFAAERMTPATKPEVWFMETAAGTPPPIKAWWYPGETLGREFIYPKEQARRLAKGASEPVLTTKAETTKTEETNTSDLSRISSNGQETRVTASGKRSKSANAGKAQQGEAAPGSISMPATTVPSARH